MGNKLFQEAQKAVNLAKNADSREQQMSVLHAKNVLSSAFANSTRAEQAQLSEMQAELDQFTNTPQS